MKIEVDRSRCTALGICESIAPAYFEVGEDGELQLLRDEAPESERAALELAVTGCPTAALSVSDD